MFKRHVYTCPDVIHMRKVQRRIAYTNLGVTALFYAVAWTVGTVAIKREEQNAEELKNEN